MKIGTSFDPGLSGELRVTVVATGLEGSRSLKKEAPVEMPRMRAANPAHGAVPGVVTPIWPQAAKAPRAQDVEIPAVMRNARPSAGGLMAALDYNEEILDIPAFLRAQAD